jgi:alpha-amylase
MAARISLALALHNHQPVGNFGWVFAEVYEQAYLPMLEALERHPSVRVSLHYTGPLLDWFAAERPDFIGRLRALVARDQVEILGGGYYEPVLASLPERDRVGQLVRMRDALEAMFGDRPRGAWLAERVWEPDLPTSLVAGGYDWTILDDAHFRAAAIHEDDLWGPYTTDDQGRLMSIFGTEQGLRYRIPFREVDDVIDYLRDHATEDGSRVGMMGDDGEKFGAWPSTWAHCWGEGRWVDRFFEALEANEDWLSTTTPSAWLREHRPIGRVYIPTGSYAEMGEWALPADESLIYATVLHDARAEDRPEARWLRGAFWRNFQVKYREINDLHKQMLRASDKVAAMPAGPARDRALSHLYKGQSNDCYWHGLFGGIYISHMRLATYEHLIAAEDIADADAGAFDAAESVDLDMDGFDEVRLASAGQVITIDPNEGAGIGGWDIRPVRHNLAAVMRRRPEAYHDLLRQHDDDAPVEAGDSTMSIHGVVRVKERGLKERLRYDPFERRSGLIRFLEPGVTAGDWSTASAVELSDATDRPFGVLDLAPDRLVVARDATVDTPDGPASVRVVKRFYTGGGRMDPSLALTVEFEHLGGAAIDVRAGVEWTLTMLGGGGNPAAWWEVDGRRSAHDGEGTALGITTLAQGNDHVGVSVTTTLTTPGDAWWAPVETISNSEAGFERVYQGSGLLLSWPVRLAEGERWAVNINHDVRASDDRADDA